MTQKADYLVDLIFKKLKNYKLKQIYLEKENLKEFVLSLLKKTEGEAPLIMPTRTVGL